MNKILRTSGILTLVLVLLNSCDCVVDHRGFVIDELTGEPIFNAKIQFDNKKYTTDQNGYFEITYVTGFCPTERYTITKSNFRDYELLIERSSESVVYEVFERNDYLENGYGNSNSNSFKVRNDTLFFYMEPLNGL